MTDQLQIFPTTMPQKRMLDAFRDLDMLRKLPILSFPPDWKITLVPPFGGAAVRFLVHGKNDRWISVYLDLNNQLGCVDEPYWEIYPNKEGDNERFLLNETCQLLASIQLALDALN